MINMLDNTDFGMKVDFSGGGQTGELGDKPSKSDWDQSISAHVWAQDWTRVTVVGGVDDDYCANLTPLYEDFMEICVIVALVYSV